MGAASFWVQVRRNQDFFFDLIAPATQIDSISLECSIVGRKGATIWGELIDTRGHVLARGQINPAGVRAANGHPVLIDGVGLRLEAGQKYRIRLSSQSGDDIDCLRVRAFRAPAGKQEFNREFLGFSNQRRFEHRALPRQMDIVALCDTTDAPGSVVAALETRWPGYKIKLFRAADYVKHWSILADASFVIFVDVFTLGNDAAEFDALCFELHRRGIVTVFHQSCAYPDRPGASAVSYGGRLAHDNALRNVQRRRCHFALLDMPPSLIRSLDNAPWPLAGDEGNAHVDADLLDRMHRDVQVGRLPRVTVFASVSRDPTITDKFLEHFARQSYPGPVVLGLVADDLESESVSIVRGYAAAIDASHDAAREVRLFAGREAFRSYITRSEGEEKTRETDLYLLVDGEAVMSRDFVAAHVFEHWFEDVEAVVGSGPIDASDALPERMLCDLEGRLLAGDRNARLRDSVQPDGFLNCNRENFSFKRRTVSRCAAALETLIFADAGMSSDRAAIELGYRLYSNGAVIRYTDLAFAMRCSHAESVTEPGPSAVSARDIAQALQAEPELALASRRWAASAGRADHALPGDVCVSGARAHRPLRVLTYRWHVPHQYELYKLPHEFTLATRLGNGMVDAWQFDQRPLRPNVRLRPAETIDPRDYDVAILHFDENVLAPHLTNGVVSSVWGEPFRWLLGLPDIPKIAICHGTVQFVGQYGADPGRKTEFIIHDDERLRLVAMLAAAGVRVVCNSHQAAGEWQFQNSEVIWHGFDPQEFPQGNLTRNVLALEPDIHRPHYRGAWEHRLVEDLLDPGIRIETARHPGAPLEMRGTNAFAVRNFRSYVDRIRSFTCYLNTTLRSPMPRSRGEAMMTGVIPVCLRNHDVDRFIEPGVDGFYADSPEELADFINYLFRDRAASTAMAAAARLKAMDVFNHDRYLASWTRTLRDVVG
ncbi:glycosyltransferase [Rhodopseudomonas boonkerdii]|uniref:glycosyltransferase n=1 Tax=Rhodopseudomonas boonkerdii TaxID=475937 RepID=UPI001E44D9E5|nr:glycosyltransferase [Rhodopseudomonas boonkerdii]